MGDFEKKIPASACRKKAIACSTNVIESLWEKREKNILPTRLLEKKKKILDDQKFPPPPAPSRVEWSAPYFILEILEGASTGNRGLKGRPLENLWEGGVGGWGGRSTKKILVQEKIK